MDRFEASPLPLSPAVLEGEFDAADLVFYDVDHSGPSFRALVFFNVADASLDTPLELDAGYAGSFVVFGHGGCFGEAGHCHVPPGHKDPFDSRPLHPLTPQTQLVDVSDALQVARGQGEYLSVTVLPIVPGPEAAEQRDVLEFSAMRLLTYG